MPADVWQPSDENVANQKGQNQYNESGNCFQAGNGKTTFAFEFDSFLERPFPTNLCEQPS